MELNQVLERLQFTIDKAKLLKDWQFVYCRYVTAYDVENACGTVCCIAGHYPNWGITEFSIIYNKDFYYNYQLVYNEFETAENGLPFFHGISVDLVNFLFYGFPIEHHLFLQFGAYYSSMLQLPQVITRFEYVHKLLAEGTILPDFSL